MTSALAVKEINSNDKVIVNIFKNLIVEINTDFENLSNLLNLI